MNRTQEILAVLLDGQPRTIEQIIALLPAELDHAQALATLSGLLKGRRVVSTHTYQVTDAGRAAVARPPMTKTQRQAEWRAAKQRQKDRQAERAVEHEMKRKKRSAISAAVSLARAADGIVIGAMNNPHPLHAAWGGARQGAGA